MFLCVDWHFQRELGGTRPRRASIEILPQLNGRLRARLGHEGMAHKKGRPPRVTLPVLMRNSDVD